MMEEKAKEASEKDEIPSGWSSVKLGSLASFNDKTLSEKTSAEKYIRYIEISDVSNISGIQYNSPIPFKDAPSRARRIVEKGDILISTVRTYLKAVSSVQKDYDNLVASTGFAVLKARKCDGNFLRYAVLGDSFMEKIISSSFGVSYPSIRSTKLASFKLLIPHNIQTQKRIVMFLDTETKKIDDSIVSMETLISLLTEKRSALISETVTRGIPGEYREFKDSGVEWLGEIPVGWEVKKLNSFTKLQGGGTPHTNILSLWDGNVTWVTPKDYTSSKSEYLVDSERTISEKGLATISGTVPENSVLMTCRAPVGNVAISGKELAMNQGFIACLPSLKVMPRYLYFGLKAANREMKSRAKGGTFQEISRSKMGAVKFPLPSIETQNLIVNYLDCETKKIDSLINEVKKSIGLLKEKRQTLISDVVTGKIDVSSENK